MLDEYFMYLNNLAQRFNLSEDENQGAGLINLSSLSDFVEVEIEGNQSGVSEAETEAENYILGEVPMRHLPNLPIPTEILQSANPQTDVYSLPTFAELYGANEDDEENYLDDDDEDEGVEMSYCSISASTGDSANEDNADVDDAEDNEDYLDDDDDDDEGAEIAYTAYSEAQRQNSAVATEDREYEDEYDEEDDDDDEDEDNSMPYSAYNQSSAGGIEFDTLDDTDFEDDDEEDEDEDYYPRPSQIARRESVGLARGNSPMNIERAGGNTVKRESSSDHLANTLVKVLDAPGAAKKVLKALRVENSEEDNEE